jgi:4'-phosphopantetheinyl transferase EntD
VQTTQPSSTLFSDVVAFVTSVRFDQGPPPLLPEEEDLLGPVSDSRRLEFALGRACARQCMRALDREVAPVLIGAGREPLWPTGLVGSITHTGSFAAAAMAATAALRGIGLDAEPDSPLPSGVLERISTVGERSWADRVDPAVLRHPGRLLFCAKEATYKVWYPLARRWLEFGDVSIEVDELSARFRVHVLVDGPFRELEGRYSIVDGLILAGIELREERN